MLAFNVSIGVIVSILGGIIIYFLKETHNTLKEVVTEQQQQKTDIAVIKERLRKE